MCGYPLEEGQEYLVYAYGKEEPLKVDLFSKIKLLSKAGANLRVLGDGKAPGGEPLPDTSGEITGLLVAMHFGIADAAAALLLLKRILKSS